MKPLIPQTVYVPIDRSEYTFKEKELSVRMINGRGMVNQVFTFDVKQFDSEYKILDKKESQYIFTKEELTELLGLAYDAVMSRKMGYDHEGFPIGVGFTKEQFINNLLKQQ